MIEIKNYSKFYGSKEVVKNISLTIEKGDIYAFIGHNGAGKTTTIKSIVGILDFDKGDILFDGISIKKDPIACKKKFAYIPDNPELYEHLSGEEFLHFILDIFKISKEEKQENILKYSKMFDIDKDLQSKIGTYSRGMKQKLALTAALSHNPKYLILDEPFVGLDPLSTIKIKEVMNEIVNSGGAVFFSTHILEVAEKLCNKVSVIKDGKITISGKMKDVLKQKNLEEVFLKDSKDE